MSFQNQYQADNRSSSKAQPLQNSAARCYQFPFAQRVTASNLKYITPTKNFLHVNSQLATTHLPTSIGHRSSFHDDSSAGLNTVVNNKLCFTTSADDTESFAGNQTRQTVNKSSAEEPVSPYRKKDLLNEFASPSPYLSKFRNVPASLNFQINTPQCSLKNFNENNFLSPSELYNMKIEETPKDCRTQSGLFQANCQSSALAQHLQQLRPEKELLISEFDFSRP